MFVPARDGRGYLRITGVVIFAGLSLWLTTWLVVAIPEVTLTSGLLLMMLEVVLVAALTDVAIAILVAVIAVGVANWFLIPPTHTFFIQNTDDIILLAVFVVAAIASSLTVRMAIRLRIDAERASVEAAVLRETLTEPGGASDPYVVLDQIARLYSFTRLLVRDADGAAVAIWTSDSHGGQPAPGAAPRVDVEVVDGFRIQGWGPAVIGEDRRGFHSLASAAVRSHESRRISQVASRAGELEATDRARSALLAAVGHDLRTPLAAISISAAALQERNAFDESDREELVGNIVASAKRLKELIANLLDMSRLEAGQLIAHLAPVSVDGAAASAAVTFDPDRVELRIEDDLPLVLADAGLLERVLANLMSNAVRHSPASTPVTCSATLVDGRVEVSVEDHGPGLPADRLGNPFEAFAASGEAGGTGLGLGLAIAKGFCEAMDATLVARPTAWGGLTMIVGLRAAL
jgi:two-component system sensor histidine kinase KdpD